MRQLTATGVLPLLFLTALPAQAQMATITPEQIGEIFCIGGLANEMELVEPLLSLDLKAAIAEAYARNAAYEAANPGDKPPLGDGLPWRTWPDYADGCTVADGTVEREEATVVINYTFSDYPDANYSNHLVLRPASFADGTTVVWRIDDVELGEGRTLRSTLISAFEP